MRGITRERPKIDRIACPWLIQRFVDPAAEFLFVPKDQVLAQAAALPAIPSNIAGAEYSHEGERCTFDTILKKHQLTGPALHQLARIVRGADTDQFELAPQAAGLWAISAGLSYHFADDAQQLAIGLHLHDALYNWAKHVPAERHTWQPE